MKQQQWVLLALAGALMTSCVSKSAYDEKIDELHQAKAQLRQVSDIAQQYGSQVDGLETDKSKLAQQNSMLRSSNDEFNRRIADLMSELESSPASASMPVGDGPIQIVPTAGGYAYRIDGGFLFSPGKAALKASAKKQLADVAEQLLAHDYRIEVAGHTDIDPVKVTKKMFPRGNIELGQDRALSVWEELVSSGVPADRMWTSSYGEHAPVRDAAEKAENRRVELRVVVEESSQLP